WGVEILRGDGQGGFFAPSVFETTSTWSGAAVLDVNSDTLADLAVANATDHVSVFIGNGFGGFGPHTDFLVGDFPTSLAVGDFNNDGTLDVATASFWNDQVSILLG